MSIESKQHENQNQGYKPEKESPPHQHNPELPNLPQNLEQHSKLTTLSNEVEANKAFAFDINQKIDELQVHIDSLNEGFKSSQDELASTLSNIRARTTSEINEVSKLVEDSDHNKQQLINELGDKLTETVNTLNDTFASLEIQFQAQHINLNQLQESLDKSVTNVHKQIASLNHNTQKKFNELVEESKNTEQFKADSETRFEELDNKSAQTENFKLEAENKFEQIDKETERTQEFKTEALKKFVELDLENEQQQETQEAFSVYLDQVQVKAHANAKDLQALDVELKEHKQESRKRFRLTTGSIISLALLTTASMIYLQHKDSSEISLFEQKLDQYSLATSDLYATKNNTDSQFEKLSEQVVGSNYQVAKMDQEIVTLKDQIRREQNSISQLTANTNESVDKLLGKISALELSLYGPKNTVGLSLKPELKIEDTNWINAQEPNHYVIQLVGVYRERSIVSFANRYATDLGDAPLSSNISTYRGQDWHNLYYGNFKTFNEAQRTLDKLPTGIQENAPWIRSMKSVQDSAKQ